MYERFIGIDPGASGGLACVNLSLDVAKIHPMPAAEDEIAELIKLWSHNQNVMAILERVTPMRGWGISSVWKFARNYGILRGILLSLGVPFDEVLPKKWQSAMGCLSRGNKNVTKAKAAELFPGLRVTHATADALLIAEYGRRVMVGYVERPKTVDQS